MEIKFSIRGNGACSICRKFKSCPIQKRIITAVEKMPDKDSYGMEAVIYTCPAFEEEF